MRYINSYKTNIIYGVKKDLKHMPWWHLFYQLSQRSNRSCLLGTQLMQLIWARESAVQRKWCQVSGIRKIGTWRSTIRPDLFKENSAKEVAGNHVLCWGNQRAVTKHSIFTKQLRTERVWDTTSLRRPSTEHEHDWGIHSHTKEH